MSIDKAIRDARRIVTQLGFSKPMGFTDRDGNVIEGVRGIASRHFFEFDEQGVPVNSTDAHVLLSESSLVDAGVTVRNANGEANLTGSLVTYTDGTGVARTYRLIETHPSETLGLLICKLGRYGTN